MSDRAWFESHALRLGKLIGNLQMLESFARMAIVNRSVDAQIALRQIAKAGAGDLVELNAFTNADGLRETLETYNSQVRSGCAVDVEMVITLRDALAHGRTFGVGGYPRLRLLKFGRKYVDGKVMVEAADTMNEEWFASQNDLVTDAQEKIRRAIDYDRRELA